MKQKSYQNLGVLALSLVCTFSIGLIPMSTFYTFLNLPLLVVIVITWLGIFLFFKLILFLYKKKLEDNTPSKSWWSIFLYSIDFFQFPSTSFQWLPLPHSNSPHPKISAHILLYGFDSLDNKHVLEHRVKELVFLEHQQHPWVDCLGLVWKWWRVYRQMF